MAKESPIINILTYGLPFKLARPIYNEYQSRLNEAKYLINNFKPYQKLENDIKVVELFLALSIFHKRVITNLNSGVLFFDTITRRSEAKSILIGGYQLTGDERNKLLGVVINYNDLLKEFSIPKNIMEYLETKELLRALIKLKTTQNKNG